MKHSVDREKALECLCTSPTFRETDNDSQTALRLNRLENSKNIIFSYFNINSIRNKFDSVKEALVNYLDNFIAAEIKINESFPTFQFANDGFHKPISLDVTNKSGGLLIYVRSYLPLRQLTKHILFSDIQALAFKVNMRRNKWFFLSIIYKLPSINCQNFLN